ncbi:MAG: LysM peptidoglycan-binding domain-containing protein [Oscillospiraceae bacterium]|nr:LysM peptidoglycan-binding domain-containing protein [Oscillospiraceae bacterium]
MLTAMKFRSFTWPNNPRTFSVERRRALKSRKLPFRAYRVQDMGEDLCVYRGAGEFTGAHAYEYFMQLAELFAEGTPGLLVHPVWPAAEVYFAGLKLRQEPLEDYVAYEFEFWQNSDGVRRAGLNSAAASGYYTVAPGESVGDAVLNTGVSAEELLRLNPWLKNINSISAGTVLRIREEG